MCSRQGSRLVVLDNNEYEEKIKAQFNRSSFNWLEEDSSKQFDIPNNNRVLKWQVKKELK